MRTVFLLLCFIMSSSAWPLDVFVRDQPIRQVLPQLAAELGKSVLLDETIDANLTLSIQEGSWEQVLNAVSKQMNLQLSWQDDIAILMPAPESILSTSGGIRQSYCEDKIWSLKHAKASKVGNHLEHYFIDIKVIIDGRTNALMTHYCGESDVLASAIKWLDSPMRQIEIAAEIAQVRDSVQQQLGVNWQGALLDNATNGVLGSVDLGIASAPVSFGVSGSSGDLSLSATLDWLEREGSATVIARPKIVTSEGQPARIESGTEVPYQVMNDDTLSVEFRQAGLILEVTPEVKDDQTLLLSLKIHQDAVGDMVNGVPSLETNRVQTQVEVKDSDTLVLGGIFREETLVNVSKVPILGNVPLLGRLFRRETKKQEKVELLVFITPKLLKMSVN